MVVKATAYAMINEERVLINVTLTLLGNARGAGARRLTASTNHLAICVTDDAHGDRAAGAGPISCAARPA